MTEVNQQNQELDQQVVGPQAEAPTPATESHLKLQFMKAVENNAEMYSKDPKATKFVLYDLQFIDEETYAGYEALLADPTDIAIRTVVDNTLFYRTYSHLAEFAERTGVQLPEYINPNLINEPAEKLDAYMKMVSSAGIIISKRDFVSHGVTDYNTKFALGQVGMKCDIEYSATSLPVFLMGCFSIQLTGLIPDENSTISYLVRVLGAIKHFGTYENMRAKLKDAIEEERQREQEASNQAQEQGYTLVDGVLTGGGSSPSFRLLGVFEQDGDLKARIAQVDGTSETEGGEQNTSYEIVLSLNASSEAAKDILGTTDEEYASLIKTIKAVYDEDKQQ